MATTNLTAGQIAAHDKQLVASTLDTVTFSDEIQHVEVLTDGAAAIYFTVDGSTPTVSGANCFKLPAGAASALTVLVPAGAAPIVKLISSGTPVYSVTRADS